MFSRLVFAFALLCVSQTSAQNPDNIIRVRSNLVVVPVSVIDTSGRPVRDLKINDLRIEEDGQPQEIISLGEPGKTPLDLALLFDISASVSRQFQFEQQAASAFLKTVLRPGDSVSVFSIGSAPKMIQARTSSVEKAAASLADLAATRETTAFFDTAVEAARYLGATSSAGTRRVLVAISDGEDTNSERFKLADSLSELQRNDCLFYSINPSGPALRLNQISMKGQQAMTALASETGGAFVPANPGDLEAVFRQIVAELQAQYLLGYYSTDNRANGEFRRITVRLPGRPELRARARRGYYAGKTGSLY